ncbi:MAG: hypothetical protein KAT43_04005 [Nanoarchaeota archaeon]|nr:hypothetical protein [Nanoarchaeota archaeon]
MSDKLMFHTEEKTMPSRLQTYLAKLSNFASGLALCSAFLFGTSDFAEAEEKPEEEITPKTIVVHPDRFEDKKDEYTREIEKIVERVVSGIYKPKKDRDVELSSSEEGVAREAVIKRFGYLWQKYDIKLDDLIKAEQERQRPGILRKFLDDLGSSSRDFSGEVIGFMSEFHQEMPEEDYYEDDVEEDYANSLYFRHLGDENFGLFLKGTYLSEEDKNSRSDGEFYGDALITILGDAKNSGFLHKNTSFLRLLPVVRVGPHVSNGVGTLELALKLGEGWKLTTYVFGGFSRSDDFYKTDGWMDASTYKWVDVDKRNIMVQSEVAVEISTGDKNKNRYRLCLFAYYRDQEVLFDYEKDYEGGINTKNYKYDWDFFEEESTVKIAFVIDPKNAKGIYLKAYGRYTQVKQREIFDNQNPPANHYNKVTYEKEGAGRVMFKFPLEDPDKKNEFIAQGSVIFGGEKYRHYGYLSLMFEDGNFNEHSLLRNEEEEPMRPEHYAKRHRYFRESLGESGTFHGFKIGYHSINVKDGEKDKLFLYAGYTGIWNTKERRYAGSWSFENLVIKTNVGYYHDIATSKQPFNLEASLELQFRTNHHHIIGIKGSIDIESDEFDNSKERELEARLSLFWSF